MWGWVLRIIAKAAGWVTSALLPLWMKSKNFNAQTGNLVTGAGLGMINLLGLQWLFGEDADEEQISQQLVSAIYTLGAVFAGIIAFLGWKALKRAAK